MHRSTVTESAKLRAGESSRGMHAQLQRVIKVPLSTIICEYFYVLLIWQRNDGATRNQKMPLYAAICPYVSTSHWHYSFFPVHKTTRITSSSRTVRETVSSFLTPRRVKHHEFETARRNIHLIRLLLLPFLHIIEGLLYILCQVFFETKIKSLLLKSF